MADTRLSRRQRIEFTDNREAVETDEIQTNYRHFFAREAGDDRVRERRINRLIDKPTASSQDPTSVYLVADFLMRQPKFLKLRTNKVNGFFATTHPWTNYWWSVKTIGDILTIIVTACENRIEDQGTGLFTTGRDHKSNWLYTEWDHDTEEWLDLFADGAEALAHIKLFRRRRDWHWAFANPSGIGPTIERMTDGRNGYLNPDLVEEAQKYLEPPTERADLVEDMLAAERLALSSRENGV